MRILRRVAFWFDRRRQAADLAAELEHHRARTQSALEADGIPAGEAAVRSRRVMGNVTLAREDAREVWIAGWVERVWRDAIYGARALRREPVFAITALLTLTLGITTTTTVFSVVDAELWKPLPFPRPSQLVGVHPYGPGNLTYERVSGPDFLDWQSETRLAEYAGSASAGRGVVRAAGAESISMLSVTANYFQVLQRPPALGRAFVPEDVHGDRAIILSETAWRRLFNGDPSVVGRRIAIDGESHAVVGVDCSVAHFANDPDAFVLLDPSSPAFRVRSLRQINVIGRMQDGVGIAQAQAELQAVVARIAAAYPEDHTGHGVRVLDLKRFSYGYNWRPLCFFLGAALLVLLLSCVNVANLLLARALRRQREFAIRGALGGGRRALARQLIVEGALLAMPSAAAGAVLSSWALRAVTVWLPENYLERGAASLVVDARVLAFVVVLSGAATILLSLAPLVFAQRIDLNLMLGEGGRTAGASPRHVRMRNALLVAQMTVTLVLLVGAGLFVSSFVRLTRMPLGFDPHDRLALQITLSGARYGDDASVRQFAAQLLDRARATPGVRDAAVDSSSPLGSGHSTRFVIDGRRRPPEGSEPSAILRSVGSDYFRTLGIRLVSGRAFTDADAPGAPPVAIVNQHLARRLFAGEDPIGQRLALLGGQGAAWTRRTGIVQIVGVADNAKDVGMNEVDFNDLYLPFLQAPVPALELVVATSIPAANVGATLRAAAAAIDPSLPVNGITSLTARVDDAVKGDRFNLILIASFAMVAILLAVVGIHGAMACAVQERQREFGVRLALGAQPGAIIRASLWESARFGVTGGALGLAAALILARLLGSALYLVEREHEGLLYGVTTTDPVALASAALAIVLVATMSGVIPARQATKVDPVIALRSA